MTVRSDYLAEHCQHHVLVPSDHPFRRKARLWQARWREETGLPIGSHRHRPLGSRLAMPFARDALANYLSDEIRKVVRKEVLDRPKKSEKLYQAPRIFDDLLSSQPLCFNLFAELHADLELASRVFARLLVEPGLRVVSIEFEFSPGRGDVSFIGDRSAFDVFVVFTLPCGSRGFVGLEVKYVEDLRARPARHRRRYEQVADAMGVFVPESRARLRFPPLEQLWRDHLLAGSLLLHPGAAFSRGTFAVVYPSENTMVEAGVAEYRACLSDATTFASWTLEVLVEMIASAGAGSWIQELRRRYLGRRKLG